jgi:hypothetical protein
MLGPLNSETPCLLHLLYFLIEVMDAPFTSTYYQLGRLPYFMTL